MHGGADKMHANALVAMAFGWHQQGIERCLIQACYRIRGFSDDDEISWLHVPHDWRGGSQSANPHTPTEIAAGDDSLSDISVVSCCRGVKQIDDPLGKENGRGGTMR